MTASDQMLLEDRGQWTSASSAPADSRCPGRHFMQRGLPDTPSDSAEFGTRVHSALCKGDPSGLKDDELAAYDTCKEKELEALQLFFGMDWEDGISVVREKRYWIKTTYPHSGQVDAVFRKGLRALIIDYKSLPSGMTEDSEENMQLRDQAVLYWHYSILLDEVGTTIAQPGRSVVICSYKLFDIERATLELQKRVEDSNNPAAKRIPGPIQCRYCRGKRQCPEYGALASTGTMEMAKATNYKEAMTQWSPDQWANFLESAITVSDMIAYGKEFAKEMLKASPNSIPGWRLDAGDERTSIDNIELAFNRFTELGGTQADFLACVKILNQGIKTELRRLTKTKGKALDDEWKRFIDGISISKRTEPSLKRAE